MAEHYFYAHDTIEHGPYSALEMRTMADAGQIEPGDCVWKEGTSNRVAASRIKNLYSSLAVPALVNDVPAVAPPSVGTPAPVARTAALAAGPAAAEVASAAAVAAAVAATVVAAPKVVDAPARVKRVVAIRGGTLCSQDGMTVRFKKKCDKCGHEDQTRSAAAIRCGSMRVPWFCPKCRKSRTVEMTGIG